MTEYENFKIYSFSKPLGKASEKIKTVSRNIYYLEQDLNLPIQSKIFLDFPVIGAQVSIPSNNLLEINFNFLYKMIYVIPSLMFRIEEGDTGDVLYQRAFGNFAFPNIFNKFSDIVIIKSQNPDNLAFSVIKIGDDDISTIFISKNSSITIRTWSDRQ